MSTILQKKYRQMLTGYNKTQNNYVSLKIKNNDEEVRKCIAFVKTIISAPHEPEDIYQIFEILNKISVSYAQEGSVYYNNKEIFALVEKTLIFLEEIYNDITMPHGNWWYWEIGIPLRLNKIFMLLGDDADKSLLLRYMKAECHFNNAIKMTGANRLWESVIFAERGILLEDNFIINQAISGIEDVLTVTEHGDGFYEDGSFIQHEKFSYNGGYGRSLIMELSMMLYLFHNSEFKIHNQDIVYKWIENSYLPFLYNGRCMDMVRGREISRYYEQGDFAGACILGPVLIISEIMQDKGVYFKECIKNQVNRKEFFENASFLATGLATALINDKSIQEHKKTPQFMSFNCMDRAVKHAEKYCVGVSMHSSRIANYESINNENFNAFHTGDGMLYLYKNDNAYNNSFWATVDFQRLPGTTVLSGTQSKPNTVSECDFVGSCGSGEYGISVMQMKNPDYTFKANKSWFFMKDEIVCLGSGISSHDNIEIETIIENRRLEENTRLTVCGLEKDGGYEAIWAYLNGDSSIGYYFPDSSEIKVIKEEREGSWENMNYKGDNKTYKDNYAKMWISHGKNPEDYSYSYIILPSCTEEEIKNYHKVKTLEIVENSEDIQCVKDKNMTGIIFLKDKARGLCGISSDKKCIVITDIQNSDMKFTIVDPTHNQDKIKVVLDYTAKSCSYCDERVKMNITEEGIVMDIDTKGASGREISVRLEGIRNV